MRYLADFAIGAVVVALILGAFALEAAYDALADDAEEAPAGDGR